MLVNKGKRFVGYSRSGKEIKAGEGRVVRIHSLYIYETVTEQNLLTKQGNRYMFVVASTVKFFLCFSSSRA